MNTVQQLGKHLVRYTADNSAEITFINSKDGLPFKVVYDFVNMSYFTETENAYSADVEMPYSLFVAKIVELGHMVSLDLFEEEKEVAVNCVFTITNLNNGRVWVSTATDHLTIEEMLFDDLEAKAHWHTFLQNSFNKHGLHAFAFEIVAKDCADVDEAFDEVLQTLRADDVGLFNYNQR